MWSGRKKTHKFLVVIKSILFSSLYCFRVIFLVRSRLIWLFLNENDCKMKLLVFMWRVREYGNKMMLSYCWRGPFRIGLISNSEIALPNPLTTFLPRGSPVKLTGWTVPINWLGLPKSHPEYTNNALGVNYVNCIVASCSQESSSKEPLGSEPYASVPLSPDLFLRKGNWIPKTVCSNSGNFPYIFFWMLNLNMIVYTWF